MHRQSEENYLRERTELFKEIEWHHGAGSERSSTLILTVGRLLEVVQAVIAEYGADVPVFSLADNEWVHDAYWEPFDPEDGSEANDWHGLSLTLE